VGLARLLPTIHGDAARWRGLHPGSGESEAGGLGFAAERVEEMAGAADYTPAGSTIFEGDRHAVGVARHPRDPGVGEKLDAFVAKGLLHHGARFGRMIAQDVRTALDQNHPAADPPEKLRQLAGHDAAAQDNDAPGGAIEVEHVVAGPKGRFGEPGTGGTLTREPVAMMNRFCRAAACHRRARRCAGPGNAPGSDKGRNAGLELADAVLGELSNDSFLSRVQRLQVGCGVRNAQAEGTAFLGEVQHLHRPEQRFRRHAAAQDAQAAELRRAIHDGNFFAQAVRHPGGIETGGATAQTYQVVGFHSGSIGRDRNFCTSVSGSTRPRQRFLHWPGRPTPLR
jgi:hypothetical protein